MGVMGGKDLSGLAIFGSAGATAKPQTHVRRELANPTAELTALAKAVGGNDDSGFVQGYAATFNNIDLGGEVMRPGAFKKTLSEGAIDRGVPLMVRHFCSGGDALDCIGSLSAAKETKKGLWFDAPFSSIGKAQDVRTLVVEKHLRTCSVGYLPVKWDWITIEGPDGMRQDVLEHLECKLLEVTVTLMPMNPEAKLTAAKTVDAMADRVAGLVDTLDALDETALSTADGKAAVLRDVFGEDADPKAIGSALGRSTELIERLGKSLSELTAETDGPRNTSDPEADLRQIHADVRRRRVRLLEIMGEN